MGNRISPGVFGVPLSHESPGQAPIYAQPRAWVALLICCVCVATTSYLGGFCLARKILRGSSRTRPGEDRVLAIACSDRCSGPKGTEDYTNKKSSSTREESDPAQLIVGSLIFGMLHRISQQSAVKKPPRTAALILLTVLSLTHTKGALARQASPKSAVNLAWPIFFGTKGSTEINAQKHKLKIY